MATQNSKKSKKAVKKTAARKPVKKALTKAKPAVKAKTASRGAAKKAKPDAKAVKGKKPVAKAKASPASKAKAKPSASVKAKPAPKKATVAKKPLVTAKAGKAPKSGAKTHSSKPGLKAVKPTAKKVIKGTAAPKKPVVLSGSAKPKITPKTVIPAKPVVIAAKGNLGSKASDMTKKPAVSLGPSAFKPNAVFKPKPHPVPVKPFGEHKVKPFEKMSEKFKPAATTATAEEPHKTRYSDKELEEFDQLIDQKLIVAREQLEFYLKQLEDMAENPDNKIKGLDDGLSSLESERVSSLASRQQKLIQHLENAKIRIKNKVYGICRETGKLISKERLRAVPHATLSIEAKQAQN